MKIIYNVIYLILNELFINFYILLINNIINYINLMLSF